MNKNIYLSSGKFAELCGTTKETLRHYHNKGILIPVKQEENGYFYYSVNQCLTFELIQLFTQTGSSLEEVKKYLDNYSIENFSVLMEKSYQNLLIKKNEIEKMIRIVKNSIEYVQDFKTQTIENRFEKIFIEKCECENFWTLQTAPTFYEDINNISQAFYQFRRFNKEHDFITEYFYTYMISQTDFLKKDYLISTLAVKTDISQKYNHIKAKGKYACIFHKGKPETIKNSLNKLNDFLKNNNLKICSPIYISDIINNQITQNEDDYVIKIFVQIS